MANCRESFKLLVDFSLEADSEEVNNRWQDLREHLETCTSCRGMLGSLLGLGVGSVGEQGTRVHDSLVKKLSGFERYYTEKIAALADLPSQERATSLMGRGKLPISKRFHLLVLLLWSRGPAGQVNEAIRGLTKLMKLVFLLKMEGKSPKLVPDFYAFRPHRFGPFEQAVYKDIEALADHGILREQLPAGTVVPEVKGVDLEEARKNAKYSLTEQGQKYAEELVEQMKLAAPDVLDEIEHIKCTYGRLSLRELLHYVYTNYPQYAGQSEILDDVFGW